MPNHPVKHVVLEQTGTDRDGRPTYTVIEPAVRKNVLVIRDRSPDGAFETKLADKVEQIVPETRDRDDKVIQERQRISKIPTAQRTIFKLIDPEDPAFPDLPRFT